MGIESLFGNLSKREREEAKNELYGYFSESNQKVLDNQAKLMAAIKNLEKKIDDLSEKLDLLQAPAAPVASAFDFDEVVDAYPAADIHQPQGCVGQASAVEAAPEPFFANLEGDQLIPIDAEMKENALFRVEPQSACSAIVEFNTLSIPIYISWGPSSLENCFDCNIVNKSPDTIVAENTTTAHFEDGMWLIDGKIRVKFV